MCYNQQRAGLHSTPKLLWSRFKQGSGWVLATGAQNKYDTLSELAVRQIWRWQALYLAQRVTSLFANFPKQSNICKWPPDWIALLNVHNIHCPEAIDLLNYKLDRASSGLKFKGDYSHLGGSNDLLQIKGMEFLLQCEYQRLCGLQEQR